MTIPTYIFIFIAATLVVALIRKLYLAFTYQKRMKPKEEQ